MDNTIFMIFVIATFLVCVLAIFSLFTIGFLIGYKLEDKRVKKQNIKNINIESDEEKKFKKEWKKFLEYDGSSPKNYE